MKKTNTAIGYALVYHGMATVARKQGYALAIHGSMLTDLDVVAIPWTDEAVDEITLLNELKRYLGLMDLLSEDLKNDKIFGAELKPHGRIAWKIIADPCGSVDLSIMPRKLKEI
ncbi:hypothetical protein KAR91_30830 [Candidatus Pacearchaeota archaeon]|nr:hypothetical protein [Candidatus Pacearchaeota archaeon]